MDIDDEDHDLISYDEFDGNSRGGDEEEDDFDEIFDFEIVKSVMKEIIRRKQEGSALNSSSLISSVDNLHGNGDEEIDSYDVCCYNDEKIFVGILKYIQDYEREVDGDIYDIAVSIMKEFFNNDQIVLEGTKAIYEMTNVYGDIMQLADKGIGAFILSVMKNYPDNIEIVVKSCDIYASLSLDDAFRAILVQTEILANVVELMIAHRMKRDIQICACDLILNFAGEDIDDLQMKLDLAKIILDVITLYKKDKDVIEVAVRSLTNVSLGQKTQQSLINYGAAEVILNLMNDYPNNDKIQADGIWVFRNLLYKNDKMKLKLAEPKFHELIIEKMKKYSHIPEFQDNCCSIISSLVINDKNREMLMEMNIQTQVVATMERYKKNSTIQSSILGLFGNLALTKESHKKLIEVGVDKLTMRSMAHHTRESSVQWYGCYLLLNFSKNAELIPKLLELGIENSIAQAKKHFPNTINSIFNEDFTTTMIVDQITANINKYKEIHDPDTNGNKIHT